MDPKIKARMIKHAGPPLRINPSRLANMFTGAAEKMAPKALGATEGFAPGLLKAKPPAPGPGGYFGTKPPGSGAYRVPSGGGPASYHPGPSGPSIGDGMGGLPPLGDASGAASAVGGSTGGVPTNRTWGQFAKQNWKPLAATGAGVTGAAALGPTGYGADAAWHMGMTNDPSRDLGYYTKDLNAQRQGFQQREIDPLMKQYDSAVAAGNYGALPGLYQKLNDAHEKLQSNNFGSAAKSRTRAEQAYNSLQTGGGTKASWWKPMVGGYSTEAGAAQYDVNNLKHDNMPVPYELGMHDPATAALHYPAQYRSNPGAGAWDPRQMQVPYSGAGGGNVSPYHNRLFSAVGLG